MNKRARVRLIGVTAIILVAVGAIILGAGSGDGSYARSVSEALDDVTLVGERVRVSGIVIDGSWDMGVKPMRFEIRDEEDANGPVINVVYNGNAPDTFGDGVIAIVTGVLSADGTIDATDMFTQCPSKYGSATGAMSVTDVFESGPGLIGNQVTVTGIVVSDIQPAGGSSRFAIAATEDGDKLGIAFDGGLPAGIAEGSAVVIDGEMRDDDFFHAVEVSLSDSEK
ncbi:MAG: cytochrome c maturation protein CcmE [Actinomycetota bacterium]|nr:cytochrome c maturation protein CcmE [Actinomycetota bacterium]